jgi:uncharacterized membrane protein (DUF4010 family)
MDGGLTYELAVRLGVAGLIGLAIGVEREWSARQSGRPPRFAGVRTFVLLGLLGGLGAVLGRESLVLGGTLLLGTVALVVVAYGLSARGEDRDATTEVAALVVVGLGALAGLAHLRLASGLAALSALLLAEKSRIHALVDRIRSEELRAGVQFAVFAAVILPVLPSGPFGPAPGFRPRELWALVLVFTGLSFAGFIALRVAGPTKGYGLAGLLGGLVSSTAVTLNFARESRRNPAVSAALGLGIIAACTVLPVRTVLLSTVLNRELGLQTIAYLVLPFAVGVGLVLLGLHRNRASSDETLPQHPLHLGSALQMAIGFQIVLYAMKWVTGRFGSPGMLASAALLGMTDMDALVYSMGKLLSGPSEVPLAAKALAVGVVSNTVLKLGLLWVIGQGAIRRIAGPGLVAMLIAGIVALVLF